MAGGYGKWALLGRELLLLKVSFRLFLLQILSKFVQEVEGVEIVVAGDTVRRGKQTKMWRKVCYILDTPPQPHLQGYNSLGNALDAAGKILGHETGLDSLDTNSLQVLAERGQLRISCGQ